MSLALRTFAQGHVDSTFLCSWGKKIDFRWKFKILLVLHCLCDCVGSCFLSNSLLVQLCFDVDADSWMCIMQLRWSACSAAVGHPGIQCLYSVSCVYAMLHVNVYWLLQSCAASKLQNKCMNINIHASATVFYRTVEWFKWRTRLGCINQNNALF